MNPLLGQRQAPSRRRWRVTERASPARAGRRRREDACLRTGPGECSPRRRTSRISSGEFIRSREARSREMRWHEAGWRAWRAGARLRPAITPSTAPPPLPFSLPHAVGGGGPGRGAPARGHIVLTHRHPFDVYTLSHAGCGRGCEPRRAGEGPAAAAACPPARPRGGAAGGCRGARPPRGCRTRPPPAGPSSAPSRPRWPARRSRGCGRR